MSEEVQSIFIVLIIFFAAAYVIKVISDNRIRRRLIDAGQIDENLKYLYLKPEKSLTDPLNSIKWGMVLFAVGLALLIGQVFPYDITETMTIGLMFLFAGIAFMIYYFIQRGKSKEVTAEE